MGETIQLCHAWDRGLLEHIAGFSGQFGQRTLLSGGALQRQRVIAPRPDSRDLPLIPLGRQEPLPSPLVFFV